MNIKLNYLLILLLTISLAGNVLFYFKIGKLEEEIQKVSQYQYKNQSSPVIKDKNQDKNDNIAYTTFSSPKADFTFEYPSDWVYDEEKDPYNPNSTNWSFYTNSEKNYDNLILAVVSPLTEMVDFCSGSFNGLKSPYQLNTFQTNDPETYVTYEQCGDQSGSGYIYWQKGEYFANAGDIKDIHKINLMKFFSNSEKCKKIAQHIAQSIKIK